MRLKIYVLVSIVYKSQTPRISGDFMFLTCIVLSNLLYIALDINDGACRSWRSVAAIHHNDFRRFTHDVCLLNSNASQPVSMEASHNITALKVFNDRN